MDPLLWRASAEEFRALAPYMNGLLGRLELLIVIGAAVAVLLVLVVFSLSDLRRRVQGR